MPRTSLRVLSAAALLAAFVAGAPVASASAPESATGCRVSAQHPNPVVLLHGTADSARSWDAMARALTARGRCVVAPDYGADTATLPLGNGIAPVTKSVEEVAALLDGILRSTGATQVDIVGHSQGGTIAEYYAKNMGRSANVRAMVLLAPVTHGTTLDGLVDFADWSGVRPVVDAAMRRFVCPACADLEVGSAFVTALNTGPIAQPGIAYAVLATREDTTATPAGAASFIAEPGVSNRFVQELDPGSRVSHSDLPRDPAATAWVLDQLDRAEQQR